MSIKSSQRDITFDVVSTHTQCQVIIRKKQVITRGRKEGNKVSVGRASKVAVVDKNKLELERVGRRTEKYRTKTRLKQHEIKSDDENDKKT